MKYYLDEKNKVYGLNDDQDPAKWIPGNVKMIDEKQAVEIANPPPSKEQLAEQAEQLKQALIAEAGDKTELWRTQLALGIITDEDKASLTEWILYVQKVQAVDTSTAPDIIWPEKPE